MIDGDGWYQCKCDESDIQQMMMITKIVDWLEIEGGGCTGPMTGVQIQA
jgi:hypothetical protein